MPVRHPGKWTHCHSAVFDRISPRALPTSSIQKFSRENQKKKKRTLMAISRAAIETEKPSIRPPIWF